MAGLYDFKDLNYTWTHWFAAFNWIRKSYWTTTFTRTCIVSGFQYIYNDSEAKSVYIDV